MYEMYVVRIMQEQTLETSDATIGIECKVEKHNNSQNRIRFKNSFANIGENVAILTLSEHSNEHQSKEGKHVRKKIQCYTSGRSQECMTIQVSS